MSLTVYENGVFHTMDPTMPRARAIVVSGEQIVFRGTVHECRDYAGGRPRRVDLTGAHVVPGLTDSHVHIAELAMQSTELDLSTAASLDEVLAMVRIHLSSSTTIGRDGDWLLGSRWNNQSWDDAALPTRAQLDSVTGEVPAALRSFNLHTYWLNSAALARLGIDRHTLDPSGGCYLRGSDGELTGIATEAAAFAIQDAFQIDAGTQLDTAIERALEQVLRVGVTSIHDVDGLEALRCFQQLHAAGRLPLRIHKLLPVAGLEDFIAQGTTSGQGDDWLRMGAIKIFADGALSARTCLLHEPYPGESDYSGVAVTPLPELQELVRRCNEHGLAVAIHAIGDAAVDNAITALEGGQRSGALQSILPNRIEHLQHLAPADLPRLGSLGVVASMQPTSCTSDIEMVERELGDRDVISYGWRSIINAGGTISFSSDAPVERINPFTGIYAATTRQRADGWPAGGWQPGECLTRLEAMTCYTLGAAFASGESATKGSLAVGRLADFAVLDRDPFAVDSTELLHTAATMTVVGGEIRWSR